ncbi:hypothetical protein RSAG8_13535, partial [Rhizoctonia solani AG-8 WAC10335]
MSSPHPIPTELESPKLDCGEEFTRRTDSPPTLARAATGRLTLAFGSKSTLLDKAQRSNTKSSSRSTKTHRSGHSKENNRNASPMHLSLARSGTRVIRSSTMRTERSDWTDQTGSPISTVSGQILSVLTGHVATPLLRSMDSLRRVGSVYLGQEGASEAPISDAPASGTTTTTEQHSPHDRSVRAEQPGSSLDGSSRYAPIRRLPDVPPVPPIPRHYATEPRPLSIRSKSVPAPAPPMPVIPRSASMNLGTSPKDESLLALSQ